MSLQVKVKPEVSVAGIVLAGTYRWHKSAFEALRPRPLLPVADKAIIDYVLGWMVDGGLRQVTICSNGSTAAVRRYLDDAPSPSLTIDYYEDGSPRGAAGCVRDAAEASGTPSLLVTEAASVPTINLASLTAQHKASGAALTIVAHRRQSGSGHHLEPTGTYMIDRDALESVPETSFQDIKESLIPKLYQTGRRVGVFLAADVSPRVLNAGTYLALNHWMIERLVLASATAVDLHAGMLSLHPTARVESGATVIGPVILGEGARVASGATIIGPASIGSGSTVGSGALVARSVVWADCSVGANAIVDRSLLADGASIEPGVTVSAALRLPEPTKSSGLRHYLAAARRSAQPPGRIVTPRPALS